MHDQIADRVANAAAATGVGSTLFGVAIGTVNEYLQAGAFIVAMISGIAATLYYIRKLPR